MLALHGFDAYGVDISQTAMSEADNYAAAELANPRAHNFASAGYRGAKEPGTVKFVQGDFFATDWQDRALDGQDGEKKFDLIYEYTVCSSVFLGMVLVTYPAVSMCASPISAERLGVATCLSTQ